MRKYRKADLDKIKQEIDELNLNRAVAPDSMVELNGIKFNLINFTSYEKENEFTSTGKKIVNMPDIKTVEEWFMGKLAFHEFGDN